MPQKQIVLQNCGAGDNGNIEACLRRGGFKALEKAIKKMSPEEVIREIKASGLRGRGGAGFPCGLKWEGARNAPAGAKYVICNADEGEVGTFKDNYILNRDPFTLIEAIAIAGYAIGAVKGYIYLRFEYHRLLGELQKALDQVKLKFPDILEIEIIEGAGAYICGEESALMESIEGWRGEPRYRPPFPTTSGLWNKPTTINNVETLMNVPDIISNGAGWFSSFGTEQSKGTKVFALSGDVKKPGTYELILGSPLRELVVDIGGAENIKAVQLGGATGRLLPLNMIDTPLSFETVLGAGAVTVFNDRRNILDIVRQTMEFLAEESCGKCTPCRQGTEVMVEMLRRLAQGKRRKTDVAVFQDIAMAMMNASLCGLGQAAPNVVMDSLCYFPEIYQESQPEKPAAKEVNK